MEANTDGVVLSLGIWNAFNEIQRCTIFEELGEILSFDLCGITTFVIWWSLASSV